MSENLRPESFDSRTRKWCDDVAGLAVDALIDSGHLDRHHLGRAAEIVAKEIYVRLALHDYPPIKDGP